MAGEQADILDHNLFLRENPGVQILYQAESPHKHCSAWLQTSAQKINELFVCLLILRHCYSGSLSSADEHNHRLYYMYIISFNTQNITIK